MKAVVFNGQLQLEEHYAEPAASPDQVLIRVTRAGICNTDMELVKGYMGFSGVLGHEFVGVVEGGPMDGQRVVGEINLACGTCAVCLGGMPTQCPNRTTLGIDRKDGAMAEWVTLPPENVHPLPDMVSDDQAVFVEPLAAGLQTLHLTHISPHDRVILIGAGKLGLLTAQVVALTGCDLTVVARHPRQHDLLAGWGIASAAPGRITARSADVVIDCTGTADGFADALEMVRAQGTIHLKSTYQGLPEANLTRVVVDEVKIESSRCGPFPAAIRLLSRGIIDVDSLIDARYPLSKAMRAFEHAAQRGVLKVLLDVA
jgi:alcohol dehydrogenase